MRYHGNSFNYSLLLFFKDIFRSDKQTVTFPSNTYVQVCCMHVLEGNVRSRVQKFPA